LLSPSRDIDFLDMAIWVLKYETLGSRLELSLRTSS
jgi:hypothetical protein